MPARAASRPSYLQSYGRRRSRRLRPGQQLLVEKALPQLAVSLAPDGAALDPASLFSSGRAAIWLEIGFGSGEHVAALAEARHAIGFIGAEPYVNGVAALLARIEQRQLANIRIWPGDVRELLSALTAASIGRAYVLFPDPWPKARHAKRRLVSPEFLEGLARVMKPAAALYLASDDAEYVDVMAAALSASRDFEPLEGLGRFECPRPAGSPPTRYEKKALSQGRVPVWLAARRRA